MKNLFIGITLSLAAGAAFALPYQALKEAEAVSGGTVINDLNASKAQAVTRTADGIYTWWVADTTSMSTGSYSVYARVALAAGVTGPRNFGAYVVYANQTISQQDTVVTNQTYRWVRVAGFDLNSVNSELRISDWSNAGLVVDKLAILKDVSIEAESATSSTIINDASASGQKAVTISSAGNYVWWSPATGDMRPGDYSVYASIASSDSASHAFGEYVALNEVAATPVTITVNSAAYQWYKLNDFVYSGAGQTVRVSDYSEPKLRVDRLKLVRATPYDENSTLQSLFANGDAALGARELVTFNGSPNNEEHKLVDPSRISVVQVNATTVYAYFRQSYYTHEPVSEDNKNVFDIYAATSSDGGLTFNILPNPIISRASTGLGTVLDPSVVKRTDGYYMVFEGAGNGCDWTTRSAYSADGLTNWQYRNTPVCVASSPPVISASTPNYFVDVQNGNQYLTWANVDTIANIATRNQATVASLWTGTLNFHTASEMAPYALPRTAPGQWDYVNTGSGSTLYEDGYYYTAYEGADNRRCEDKSGASSQWGLGIMRTSSPAILNSWVRSAKNPLIMAGKADSCWIQYPNIAKINGETYLYYNYPLPNWTPQSNPFSTFRHKLIQQ